MFCLLKMIKNKINQAYISKYNWNRENKVTFFMTTGGKKCDYLAIKNLLAVNSF